MGGEGGAQNAQRATIYRYFVGNSMENFQALHTASGSI